jgi:serine/threonine-protein kinase
VRELDSNVGKKLDDRYELLELIGVGGMADIYRAKDLAEDRIVAVKIMKDEYAGSAEFLRQFRTESKAIALLSHPNIVRIFDVGARFIVMEYIDGITLSEYIEKQGVLKWRDAVLFSTQILRALQHAHDRGIVHRDIKSSNVMLLNDGTIKVMDFGIARFSRDHEKTNDEKAIGSVHYISPEQARGESTDERSDIYSVGVMLYEMLTGRKPFNGDTPVAIALKHMQNEPRKPTEINSSIPEGLEEITLKAMQKIPAKRYQTAGEMISDIDEFKRNPSIVFEYKYFPTESKSYLDRGNNSRKETRMSQQRRRDSGYEPPPEDEDDFDEDDLEEEVAERRSPLLPILFAVASVFVILTAVLIWKLVTDGISSEVVAQGEAMKMPNLIGMDYEAAMIEYPYLNLAVAQDWSKEFEKGVIMDQSPSEGREIKSNQQIEVTLSKGPHQITIDDYTKVEAGEAEILIKNQGFPAPKEKHEHNDTIPAGFVIRTDPEARTRVDDDTVITLFISMGALGESTNVPDLLNVNERDLDERAEMYHIVITKITAASDAEHKGYVIAQSIEPMTEVPYGTTVEVTIGTGEPDLREVTLKLGTVTESVTGNYTFEYYRDASLLKDLTETRRIELDRDLDWTIKDSGLHEYSIYITSELTGKSAEFARYSVDFTTDPPTQTSLYRNAVIFREINDTSGVTPGNDETEPDPSENTDDPAYTIDPTITADEPIEEEYSEVPEDTEETELPTIED